MYVLGQNPTAADATEVDAVAVEVGITTLVVVAAVNPAPYLHEIDGINGVVTDSLSALVMLELKAVLVVL